MINKQNLIPELIHLDQSNCQTLQKNIKQAISYRKIESKDKFEIIKLEKTIATAMIDKKPSQLTNFASTSQHNPVLEKNHSSKFKIKSGFLHLNKVTLSKI